MENEQYLYFAVSKEQLEQITSKRKSILNTDIYSVKVKKFHSSWRDSEIKFSTEIFADSRNYVLLRTTIKWHEHNIKSLSMDSNDFCEIHYDYYGSDSYVLTTYYTDENLNAAIKNYDLKILDKYSEVKRYLYFVVRQSVLDKLVFTDKENHYKLRVGSKGEFVIGCNVINKNNEKDPYVLLRSTSDLQNSFCFVDAIKSLENDFTVIGSKTICRIYYNKYGFNGHSYCDSNMIDYICYFTDEELESMMTIYEFEKEDTKDSSIYSFKMKNGIDFNTIAEYVKDNKITKENKDMPPYKHHITTGALIGYFGDCSGVHSGAIQEIKHIAHITVKDIKFNGPATIIFYEDGSKEVVKRQENDKIDKEKAIYMAMLKHKNKKLFSIINKALSSKDPEKALAYELIKYEGVDVKLLHQLCNNFIKAEKPKKKVKKTKATKKVKK